MKLYYVVSNAQVKTSNGNIVAQGEVVCTFDSEQLNQNVKDAFAMVNCDLVDKEEYEAFYKTLKD